MKSTCCSCHRPKANLECPVCEGAVCKACAQFPPEGSFTFLEKIPPLLSHPFYCPACFDANIAVPLSEYEANLEKAKAIAVFMKNEGKRTRLFSRKAEPVTVPESLDRDELILRLAFLAALKGHNAIIDVDLKSEKVMNGSHRYLKWSGSAVPCHLSEKELNQQYYD